MFILNFALYVMVICMVINIFNKFDLKEYFNIDEDVSKPVRFTTYAAIAYFVMWALSFLIFPIAVLIPIVKLVVVVTSWWWLIETVQSGKVAVWFQDAKAYFNSK